MDSKEFYKQLMLQYTFDSEKIRKNAKKAAHAQARRQIRRWLPAASTAAMLILVIGAFAISAMLNNNGLTVISDSNSLTALERIRYAQQNYKELSANGEYIDMYVSFGSNLNYTEMTMALSGASDTGEVQAKIIYFSDASKALNSSYEIHAIKESGKLISGIKVSAPSTLYNAISSLKSVFLVELPSQYINDDTFVPVCAEDVNEQTMPSTDVSAPITEAPANTEPPAQTDTHSDTQTPTSESEFPSETTSDTSQEIPQPLEVTTLELLISNAQSSFFINENTFVVLTDVSLDMYTISDGEERNVTQVFTSAATSLKTNWSDSTKMQYLITGCDENEARRLIWYVDGNTGTIVPVTPDNAEYEHCEIKYCAIADSKLILTMGNLNTMYLCVADITATDTLNLEKTYTLLSSDCPISVLGAYGNDIYYGYYNMQDGSDISSYLIRKVTLLAQTDEQKATGELPTEISEPTVVSANEPIIWRNFTLEHTVLVTQESDGYYVSVFSAETGNLSKPDETALESPCAVQFSTTDDEVFCFNDKYYRVGEDGGITKIAVKRAQKYFTPTAVSDAYDVYEILADKIRILLK